MTTEWHKFADVAPPDGVEVFAEWIDEDGCVQCSFWRGGDKRPGERPIAWMMIPSSGLLIKLKHQIAWEEYYSKNREDFVKRGISLSWIKEQWIQAYRLGAKEADKPI